MSVYFFYGANTCRLRNPELENNYKFEQKITYGRSAAGKLYRYNKGVSIKSFRLEWKELTFQEKESLEAIVESIGANDFFYTDHAGIVWNACLINGTLEFTEISDELDTVDNFALQELIIPSTLRKNSRWSVQMEMEIWP